MSSCLVSLTRVCFVTSLSYQLMQMMLSLKSVLFSTWHRHIARRDGPRSRSSVHGRPQFVVFFSHPNSPLAYLAPIGGESEPATITLASLSVPLAGGDEP
ncbi:hypothetical protein LOK49_LG06G02843 [Camellia lanceoleosa]|uniref:Uncharacterized protein n=1 Tax=Camellia lanceoleosa TaxID=1840588 RepID=A0ACC0HCI3_9ERIC|nr:hypothetical protein LOK49_LG06G02843 [Camellia lanceoleosa]